MYVLTFAEPGWTTKGHLWDFSRLATTPWAVRSLRRWRGLRLTRAGKAWGWRSDLLLPGAGPSRAVSPQFACVPDQCYQPYKSVGAVALSFTRLSCWTTGWKGPDPAPGEGAETLPPQHLGSCGASAQDWKPSTGSYNLLLAEYTMVRLRVCNLVLFCQSRPLSWAVPDLDLTF